MKSISDLKNIDNFKEGSLEHILEDLKSIANKTLRLEIFNSLIKAIYISKDYAIGT